LDWSPLLHSTCGTGLSIVIISEPFRAHGEQYSLIAVYCVGYAVHYPPSGTNTSKLLSAGKELKLPLRLSSAIAHMRYKKARGVRSIIIFPGLPTHHRDWVSLPVLPPQRIQIERDLQALRARGTSAAPVWPRLGSLTWRTQLPAGEDITALGDSVMLGEFAPSWKSFPPAFMWNADVSPVSGPGAARYISRK